MSWPVSGSAGCIWRGVWWGFLNSRGWKKLQVTGQWEQAGELLAAAAKSAEAAGAELLLLCTNTMHKVAGQIQEAVSIPLLHLADTTAAAVRRAGLSTVGLLGTAFTMEQDFFRDRLGGPGPP